MFFHTTCLWKDCIDRIRPITNSKLFCCLLFFWSRGQKPLLSFSTYNKFKIEATDGTRTSAATSKMTPNGLSFSDTEMTLISITKKVNTEKWQKWHSNVNRHMLYTVLLSYTCFNWCVWISIVKLKLFYKAKNIIFDKNGTLKNQTFLKKKYFLDSCQCIYLGRK